MSYANNDEIRGVLIQAGQERVLLPNATVAEVMSRVAVEPLPDMPHWVVGRIDWYGWKVPLLSFARLSGMGEEPTAVNNKVIVLKALGGNPALPYFALLSASFPQLISVPRDGLLADASKTRCPRACTCACCWASKALCCRTWTPSKRRSVRCLRQLLPERGWCSDCARRQASAVAQCSRRRLH